MSRTTLLCGAALMTCLAPLTAARAQAQDGAIPNLASADFGWQHGFLGLNFQPVEGKIAPTGRGPGIPISPPGQQLRCGCTTNW
jgi:hypothetical protein